MASYKNLVGRLRVQGNQQQMGRPRAKAWSYPLNTSPNARGNPLTTSLTV
jgi:hypothetical protein